MMAMLGSLTGAFNSGDLDIATLMSIAPELIASPDWQVATSPMSHMRFMYERMADEGQRQALETRFREALGTKVSLTRRGEGGRVVIHFYSEEELNALYERIVGREP